MKGLICGLCNINGGYLMFMSRMMVVYSYDLAHSYRLLHMYLHLSSNEQKNEDLTN